MKKIAEQRKIDPLRGQSAEDEYVTGQDNNVASQDLRDTIVVRIVLDAVEETLERKEVVLGPEDIAEIEGRIVRQLMSMK